MEQANKKIDEWIKNGNIKSMLDLSSLNLRGLPDLPNSLQELDCSHNFLSILPTLPVSLKYLNCGNNLLSSLPDFPPNLRIIKLNDKNIILNEEQIKLIKSKKVLYTNMGIEHICIIM